MDAGAMAELESLMGSAAVIVATRDAELRTHVARGWGPRLDVTTDRLDLVLTAADDAGVVADLEANGAIAITLAQPTNYKAMQVKGTVEWIGELTADDHERSRAHLARFTEQGVAVGMTPSLAVLLGERWIAVRVHIDKVFEQTPGAGAGRSR